MWEWRALSLPLLVYCMTYLLEWNGQGFVYSASKNASACVLSPPRGRKNCKMATEYLTALACKVGFSKGFWHTHLQICPPTCWLSLVFGVLSHTEVDALTLCEPIHAGQSTCLFPSLPLANTSVLILPGPWLISSAILHCPWVHVCLYVGTLLFLHKVDDEVYLLNLFIRAIFPHNCPQIPCIGL